jgi:hypothetical protein
MRLCHYPICPKPTIALSRKHWHSAAERDVREHADPPHPVRRLLPAPQAAGDCRAAEQRDELAARAHSITSSARAGSVGGIVRPSALVVFYFDFFVK